MILYFYSFFTSRPGAAYFCPSAEHTSHRRVLSATPGPTRTKGGQTASSVGVTKRCRLSWLTNCESKCGGMWGCQVSACEQSCAHHVTWSPNKLWRSNSIFNLWVKGIVKPEKRGRERGEGGSSEIPNKSNRHDFLKIGLKASAIIWKFSKVQMVPLSTHLFSRLTILKYR